jgi:hypothetical protein
VNFGAMLQRPAPRLVPRFSAVLQASALAAIRIDISSLRLRQRSFRRAVIIRQQMEIATVKSQSHLRAECRRVSVLLLRAMIGVSSTVSLTSCNYRAVFTKLQADDTRKIMNKYRPALRVGCKHHHATSCDKSLSF